MRLVARETEHRRCPYCHDLLVDQTELVTCMDCGTAHHAVCATELGRCSVLGCASLVVVERAPGETPEVLEIRRRIRARLQRFVHLHGRDDPVLTPPLRLRAEIVRAKEAWDRQDWGEVSQARLEITCLEDALDPAEVAGVWEALGFERAEVGLPETWFGKLLQSCREALEPLWTLVFRLTLVAVLTVALSAGVIALLVKVASQ